MCTKTVLYYSLCKHTIEEEFIHHRPICRELIIDSHTINDQLCNRCLPTPPTSDDSDY